MEKYDITDYLKDDKELQKAVIDEFLKEIAELKAYKDVNEVFKTAWEELKDKNERLKEEILKWQKAYSRQYQINGNKGYNKKEEQYRQTLQEIKAIVCGNYEIIDPQGRKDILKLITKAESEGQDE